MLAIEPTKRYGEERERLWNDLNRVVDTEGNEYRLCAWSNVVNIESRKRD